MSSVPKHYSDSSQSKSFALFMALDALSLICLVVGLGSIFGKSSMPFHASELVAWSLVAIGALLMTISIHGIFKGLRLRQRNSMR
ncbi:MAG: hypothetical protein RL020_205 [Pseudomonadota bacterium]|jgi:hypothetical protein